MSAAAEDPIRIVGRYELHDAIATGGMATVHLGKLRGEVGFTRTVAIKRLHPQFSTDPEFRAMFLEEARLASRIRHPNVVSVIDVVEDGSELLLVMEYILGEPLGRLLQAANAKGQRVPPSIAVAFALDLLAGLQAAHRATDETGENLGIVHRDVSPQNLVVGADGIARVLDFGIAKAANSASATQEGQVKGKLAYMAPEQLEGMHSQLTDLYAAGIVLWETLAGRRLFLGKSEGQTVANVLAANVEPASLYGAPAALDEVLRQALCKAPEGRFQDAQSMATALRQALEPSGADDVASWLGEISKDSLWAKKDLLAKVETTGPKEVRVHSAQAARSRSPHLAWIALAPLLLLALVASAFYAKNKGPVAASTAATTQSSAGRETTSVALPPLERSSVPSSVASVHPGSPPTGAKGPNVQKVAPAANPKPPSRPPLL
jgi:eukaryotic-like serine/threonine-protein kinase